MNAKLVYEKLISQGILNSCGNITFSLGGRSVLVESRDSVGNLLQNWFEDWLSEHFPSVRPNKNSQEFPDIFLNPHSDITDLLEVKTFDIDRGPGFDIANFDSYCNSLITKSYRLDSDYLIFAYRMEGSKIEITNIWLKKVWEIAGPSGTYPLKVQEKKSIIYNIRPVTWYSTRSRFLPFNSKKAFLDALNETRYKYPKTHYSNAHWKRLVNENIQKYRRLRS